MRIPALCSLIMAAVFALGTLAVAKEPGWCAAYRNGGNNCGFYTYEQCMAAVSGVGGFCNRSPYAEPEKPAARKEQTTKSKNAWRRCQNPSRRLLPRNRRPPLFSHLRRSPFSLRLHRRNSRPIISRRRGRLFCPGNTKPASRR